MKHLKIIHLAILLLIMTNMSGQYYTRSVGIRGGESSGFIYRNMNDELSGMEFLLSFRKNGVQVTLLREFFDPGRFDISEFLFLVTGYGAHAGFAHDDEFSFFYQSFVYDKRMFSPVLGVDGYIGLEYRLKEMPLIISFDYKPYFEFSANKFFSMNIWDTAFSLRYRF